MMHRIISISLVVMLFGLTFNAYACLIPLYGAEEAPMECESSNAQAVREYCDVFKTLGVEHIDQADRWLNRGTTSIEETHAVILVEIRGTTASARSYDRVAPPVGEVLAKLSVLRL